MNLAPEYSQGTECFSSFKAVGYGCHQAVLLLFCPFHARVWEAAPVWGENSCSLGRKLQPQARMVHTRKPCPGHSGARDLIKFGSPMSFPSPSAASQRTWQSQRPLHSRAPYPATHRQQCSQWHLAKTGSSTGLSEGAWAGTGLRDVRSLLSTSVPGPVPESCPRCWQKSLLGATQRAGEGAGVRLALEEPVNSPGSGFINASLSADQEQKH